MADLEQRKAALTTQLESHRRQLAASAHGMRERLELSRRFKESFATYPWAWIGAAAVVGFVLTRRRPRKKPSERPVIETHTTRTRGSITLGTLKFLFDIARPALIPLFSDRLADLIARRMRSKREP
jgi:hypothetical protein